MSLTSEKKAREKQENLGTLVFVHFNDPSLEVLKGELPKIYEGDKSRDGETDRKIIKEVCDIQLDRGRLLEARYYQLMGSNPKAKTGYVDENQGLDMFFFFDDKKVAKSFTQEARNKYPSYTVARRTFSFS